MLSKEKIQQLKKIYETTDWNKLPPKEFQEIWLEFKELVPMLTEDSLSIIENLINEKFPKELYNWNFRVTFEDQCYNFIFSKNGIDIMFRRFLKNSNKLNDNYNDEFDVFINKHIHVSGFVCDTFLSGWKIIKEKIKNLKGTLDDFIEECCDEK